MSQFMYIASPVPIETGSFGSRKIDIETIKFLDDGMVLINGKRKIKDHFGNFKGKDLEWFQKTLLILNEGPGHGVDIGSGYGLPDKVTHHFDNKYIYTLQMTTYIEKCDLNRIKDLRYDKEILCDYLKRYEDQVKYFEIYSCWADEEDEPKGKCIEMTLAELVEEDYLKLPDKHYLRINTKKTK